MILAKSLLRKSCPGTPLDHCAEVEGPRDVRRSPISAAGDPSARRLRHHRRVRRLRDHCRLGYGAPRLPAPAPALRPRRPWRALAHDPDERHESGALRGCLHRLSTRELPREGCPRRHRRHDLAPQPGRRSAATRLRRRHPPPRSPAPSLPQTPPRQSGSTGPSRTAGTGCSPSSAPKTSPTCVEVTASAAPPPTDISPATSPALPRTSSPSSPAETSQGRDPDRLDAILAPRPA